MGSIKGAGLGVSSGAETGGGDMRAAAGTVPSKVLVGRDGAAYMYTYISPKISEIFRFNIIAFYSVSTVLVHICPHF